MYYRPGDHTDARRTVVYLAGVRWDAVHGTDHHLTAALGVHHDVIWVDPPGSARSERRETGKVPPPIRADRLTASMVRVRTAVPAGPVRPGLRQAAATAEAVAVRWALRSADSPPLATVVTSPEPRSARWCPRPLVHYATDDFVAGAHLLSMAPRRLAAAEREHLRHSDAVLAVSEPLAARWRPVRPDVGVLLNGCDASFYGAHALDPPISCRLEGPVAGVIGQLSDRLSLDVLEAVVRHGCRLLLVGPRIAGRSDDRWARLLSHPDVEWLGFVSPDRLPSVMARLTVGLVPYAETPFNLASFPLKTLEYLSAGLPVVSTNLPAVAALGAPDVVVTSTADAFAGAVQGCLSSAPGTADEEHRRREFAARHDWSRRAESLLAVVHAHR